MQTVRVVIQFDYDLDIYLDPEDEPTTAEQFIRDSLDEYVYEDLTDLMRGSGLKSWAEITVIDKEQD